MAGLKKQLSTSVPVVVLNDKLKEKDNTHALVLADRQAAADASEENRLGAIRLREEVERLQKADEQQIGRASCRERVYVLV